MDEEDELTETARRNLRGYNDYWAWKDKTAMERGAVRDALTSAGFPITQVHLGEDPPDCWVELDGRQVSVEVTELVCSKALKATFASETKENHYRLWDEGAFRESIAAMVTAKSDKLKAYDARYDENWLLIVTDEFDLYEARVAEWLRDQCTGLRGFTRVLIALSYHPSTEGGHIPTFFLRTH